MSEPLRIFYAAAGPGNVIGTYNYWIKGQDDPSELAITISSQFYDLCRDLNAQAYVISSYREKKLFRDDRFIIEHRPILWRSSSGLLYHLGQIWYGLRLIVSAVCFRANVAVVAEGATHWFVLSLLPWLGVQTIPSIHTVLWPQYVPRRQAERFINRLNRNFFANDCVAILTVSDETSKQVVQVAGGECRPIVRFHPIYRQTEFSGVGDPDEIRSPFRVLFSGRIEQNKGVFDLLEIAKRFDAEGRQDIRFDVCGSGSALNSLHEAVKLSGLISSFVCHGYCNKLQMHEMLSQSHVIIVPTRADFEEGFNKVVVEGVLCGRPVVTSAVCPALSYVRDSVVEVKPNDIKAYGDALLKLCDDREFYQEKRQQCKKVQEQFYDISRGWGAALKSILAPSS